MPKQLSDLYAALRARAQEPAPAGAHALYIAGRRCGWATHAACDALQGAAHIDVDTDALRIGAALPPARRSMACSNRPRNCCAKPTA
ncbi:Uncharacterised protein [Achromobacter xylosoxidans]|nr:Uncharacterised protein [Achromobacter xylosoxidans]